MVTVTLRQTFVLSCLFGGFPKPTIHWSAPSGLSADEYDMETSGELIVFSANAHSIGVYSCVGSNLLGNDTGYVEVNVQGIIDINFMTA